MQKLFPLLLILALFKYSGANAGCNITLSHTSMNNCGNDVCLNATGGTSPYAYSWDGGITTNCFYGMPPGIYIVQVVDAMGCTATDTVVVSNGFSVTMSSTPAFCTNGTATATVNGGASPFTYFWSTNPVQTSATATGLVGGLDYNVQVTDDSGCTVLQTVNIPSLSNLSAAISSMPDTCGRNVGSLIGYATSGIPPYSYEWNTGDTTQTLTSVLSGLYSFTITDDSGCTAVSSVNLQNYSPVMVALTDSNPDCVNLVGSITALPSGGIGPYTFYWHTNPVQTDSTAIVTGNAIYSVTVTDQQGCSTTVSEYLIDNSQMTLQVNNRADTCGQGLGRLIVIPQNGIPPYSYNWLQLPGLTSDTASGLHAGWYTCFVTDSASCVRKVIVYVSNYSPVSVQVSTQNASCVFTPDGEATAIVNNGVPPYTFNWPFGGSGSSASGLLPGNYGVSVTDGRGCFSSNQFVIAYDSILTCAVIIEGKVYRDTNTNCILDPLELPMSNVKIRCEPGSHLEWTDFGGNYQFILPPGNYEVYQYTPPWNTQICPASLYYDTLPVVGMIDTNDFANNGNAIDFAISCDDVTPPIPGFTFTQHVDLRNLGSLGANANVYIHHDPRVVFLNASLAPANYNVTTSEILFGPLFLAPNQASYNNVITIEYYVPDTLPLGSILYFTDSILPLQGDTVIYNNYSYCTAVVVGSYDPNAIEVMPEGSGAQGFISPEDSLLTYTIHFQNTGTYFARNVTLTLQLDQDLDLFSFNPYSSSHTNTFSVSPTGLLTVIFDYIMLPDSNYDEPASHGFFSFTIRQSPNLSAGTTITEEANIYFDFNQPVVTNVALNTITGLEEISSYTFQMNVHPNPAHDEIRLQYSLKKNASTHLRLLDVLGKVHYDFVEKLQAPGTYIKSIMVPNQLKGVFFLELESGGISETRKVVLF